MTKYKASLHNQKVYREVEFIQAPKLDAFKALGRTVVSLILAGVIILFAKGCDREPMPAVIKSRIDIQDMKCGYCHVKPQASNKKMVNYFKSKGSKHPKEMADALNGRKHKRLLAAISIVETGADPTKRNSGYKKRHHGAFQVNPEYWGKVPKDAAGQARQAEAILIELTREMPLQKALSAYGGDSTDKYQRKIMAELARVPK